LKPEDAFGAVLRDLRNKKNISQETLALESELDRTFISLMERGQRQPSLTTILQLAVALDVKPEELVSLVTQKLAKEAKNEAS